MLSNEDKIIFLEEVNPKLFILINKQQINEREIQELFIKNVKELTNNISDIVIIKNIKNEYLTLKNAININKDYLLHFKELLYFEPIEENSKKYSYFYNINVELNKKLNILKNNYKFLSFF